MLAPGLIDLRVKTGEPGTEPKETLKSASRAAAAGGVTSIVVQPDTHPTVDDPSVVDFILRRARDIELVHVYPAGAATRGCQGEQLAEIGLMAEAGAVYFTDVDRPIVNSKAMRRVLSLRRRLQCPGGAPPVRSVAQRGASATESEFAARLGLPAAPAAAEKIMLERDLALVELTGTAFLVDQILHRRGAGLPAPRQGQGSRRLRQLFDQPPALQRDRHRRLSHLLSPRPAAAAGARPRGAGGSAGQGLIDVVVSAHAPAPAEDKRRPFSEAAPGAVGLETLSPALLSPAP